MYLNGEYGKIIEGGGKDNNNNDSGTDLSGIECLKQSQDVDEWLLGGLSNDRKQEEEDSMIIRKIEEN